MKGCFFPSRAGFGVLLALLLAGLTATAAQAADFRVKYGRGKVLLRQGLYADAIKEFRQAIQLTAQGKTHFGVHYYLAVAYYRLGNITQSMRFVGKATPKIKNKRQRTSLVALQRKIKALFGQLRIIPEVDPDTVGRLKISLRVKNAFSNSQKLRAYRIIRKQWGSKGIVLKRTAVLYLPKGEYEISIAQPQCLRFGLTLGGAVQSEVTISSRPSSFALKAKQSCECPGGQALKKTKAGKLTCECPKGTVWSQQKRRCEIPKNASTGGSWASRNWWVFAIVGVAAASGIVVGAFVLNDQLTKDQVYTLGGNLYK